MFEAKLEQAGVLKCVLDAIRELVTDVNFNCDEDGMKLQAMDNSHVALVALQLRASGFGQYRCDRQMTLGINVPSFQKITKCAAPQDILTLRANDDADILTIIAETLNTDRIAEYEMKMMDIDIEHLGIPETRYDAEVTLPSSEFNRIIRDLKEMGESIRIEATKEGVTFIANGDIGKGSVILKHNADAKKSLKVGQDEDVIDIGSDEEKDDEDEGEDNDGDEDTKKMDKKPLFKKDPDDEQSQDATVVDATQDGTVDATQDATVDATQDATQDIDMDKKDVKPKINGAKTDKKSKKKKPMDEEDEEDDEEDYRQNDDEDNEDNEDANEDEEDEEDELPKSKKRKLSKKASEKSKKNGPAKSKGRKSTKEKKEKKEEEEEDLSVSISLQQSVSLTFSIKYLSNFTKATPLAKRLTLHMSNEVPLLVAYEFDTGYVRYYLAPKIEDD
ncbi:hypothetical protein PCASD_08871 [Puccinia coronata f. sp. avenae]|uniref:DNA sliding clamp PCNA n=1 Tax=Puccinia coronata f. sp. avenae TaxID=200324 RepID=A0A2N5UUN0_9BASI|nr:hypothetical protein PCASD_08871 [Puccinia coronata f. sp. avenae]